MAVVGFSPRSMVSLTLGVGQVSSTRNNFPCWVGLCGYWSCLTLENCWLPPRKVEISVVLTCVSIIARNNEHFEIFPNPFFSFENSLSRPQTPYFEFFLCFWVFLNIFLILILRQILSHSMGFPFIQVLGFVCLFFSCIEAFFFLRSLSCQLLVLIIGQMGSYSGSLFLHLCPIGYFFVFF